jgi:nitroreductase
MSLIMRRKSIRQYTSESVSDEHIKSMLTSAMQAPTAFNQQAWEFVVIKNRETLEKLSIVSKGAWMLSQAPLCITVIIKESGLAPHMAQQDCAAATENILLEAVNLGLGAVWIGVYPLEDRYTKVNEILNIKDGNAFCNIAIGHPKDDSLVSVRFDESKIHYEVVE